MPLLYKLLFTSGGDIRIQMSLLANVEGISKDTVEKSLKAEM